MGYKGKEIMTEHNSISLERLKQKADVTWRSMNEMIAYKRELLDLGERVKAESVDHTIDWLNARWSMLDDLIEELEHETTK